MNRGTGLNRGTRWTLLLPAVVWLLGCGAGETKPRLVVIGVDGGSWNVIDPLLEAGELPHLAALRERGVTADLETVEPVLSPVVWTSIATGRSPEHHGVEFFYADRFSIRVPTVWERLAAAGLRVGLYDYLLTWPARSLPGGFVVPGWLRRDDRVSPPDLFERAGVPAYFYEVVNVGGPEDVIANAERELREKPRTWNRLAAALEPDVGVVSFYALDAVCHRFYHTARPHEFDPPPDPEPAYSEVIPTTVQGIDRAIGEIVSALGPRDHVIIVSDHGFQALPKILRRWAFDTAWLVSRGGIEVDLQALTVFTDWRYMGFRIDVGPPEEREALIRQLENLYSTVTADDGRPLFRLRVVRRPGKATAADVPEWMLPVIASQPPAYAFVFALKTDALEDSWPDGVVRVGAESVALRRFAALHDYSGHHHPTGIFLAAGRAIRHRTERTRISVLDVAPLVTYLAGEPLPDDLERPLNRSLIEPEALELRPPRRVAAAEVPRLPEEEGAGATRTEDEEIKRRLRALGYIE